MRKLFVVVSVLVVAFITFVGFNYVKNNGLSGISLDYDDSGFPEMVRVDYDDSGFPEMVRVDYDDSGFPEMVRVDYDDSGFPEMVRV